MQIQRLAMAQSMSMQKSRTVDEQFQNRPSNSFQNAQPRFGLDPLSTGLIIGGVALVAGALTGVRIVDQSSIGVVERWGKMRGTRGPGLSYVAPLGIDQVRHVPVNEVYMDLHKQSVITKENAPLNVDGVIYYKITDPKKSLYNVQDLQGALQQVAMADLRNVIGEMTLDETLSSREKVGKQLTTMLNKEVEPWGVEITRCNIRDIEPPIEIQEALRKQLTAERERRAALINADADSQAVKTRAEGMAQATLIKATADAKAIEAVQTTQNKMIREQLEAMKNANPDAAVISLKQVEALRDLSQSKGNNLVVVPTNATSLGGNIAMLGSMLKKALQTDSKNNSTGSKA